MWEPKRAHKRWERWVFHKVLWSLWGMDREKEDRSIKAVFYRDETEEFGLEDVKRLKITYLNH